MFFNIQGFILSVLYYRLRFLWSATKIFSICNSVHQSYEIAILLLNFKIYNLVQFRNEVTTKTSEFWHCDQPLIFFSICNFVLNLVKLQFFPSLFQMLNLVQFRNKLISKTSSGSYSAINPQNFKVLHIRPLALWNYKFAT